MMATGSATEYQILTTKVKISAVESQKVDLVAALTAQQAVYEFPDLEMIRLSISGC